MKARARGPKSAYRAAPAPQNPWVIRGIVIVAVLIVVTGVIVAAANGILFEVPKPR